MEGKRGASLGSLPLAVCLVRPILHQACSQTAKDSKLARMAVSLQEKYGNNFVVTFFK